MLLVCVTEIESVTLLVMLLVCVTEIESFALGEMVLVRETDLVSVTVMLVEGVLLDIYDEVGSGT